jgi:tetratricopeptide (TPR) repeat protein
VFISHTAELRQFPRGGSYVAAVERAISACGHVIVDMADFPAADLAPADLCAERVRGCQVYVGLLGTRYGSPVRDRPQVSYPELEFEVATEAGLERLMFVLDTGAEDVGIPPSGLIDLEFGARQDTFRRRVRGGGLVTQSFTDPATLGQLVERSLRELAERRRRAGAAGTADPAGPAPSVVAGEIPQEPVGFQPRADLLAALDEPGSQGRVVCTVTGMRGVGKTHLAAAYARARLADGWRLVAWINAEEESGLLAGLAEVAGGLGLAADTADAAAAGRAVRHWLEAGGERCLLVFDNATDPAVLRPFLPAAGQSRVIVTSSRQAVATLGVGVPVEVFSEAEALTFLAARTGLADAAGAAAVADELGRLPLALAQAAAVIAAQHLSYDTYLDRLRRLPVADLLVAEEGGGYPRGVAAAILLAVEAVRAGSDGVACEAVLGLLSVLSPSGTPRSLLHAAAEAGLPGRDGQLPGMAAEVADGVLARLAGMSLVTFSVDGSAVTAHRMVMRVIRESLAAEGLLTAACEAAALVVDQQAIALRERWHQNRAATRDLIDQITALAEAADRCLADDSLHRAMIRLRWWAVIYLNYLGDGLGQAIVIGERLVADQVRLLGPDHPDTLGTMNVLAAAYGAAVRTDEAIAVLERIVPARERLLGPDDPDTLESRNNLAVAYRAAGRTDEAITLHVQILAARERLLGPDHPDTLHSQKSLAVAYLAAGRTDEAITIQEQALAVSDRVLGPDHPDSLHSRNNLAVIYQGAGRTGEAMTLDEQVLAARERLLGPDHPDTLASRNNLAVAYLAAGRTNEAMTLNEQVLAAYQRVLGPDHPDTRRSRANLADAYRAAGRSGDAEKLDRED